VQKALDEGRLKFGDKTKQPMQVDVDPLKKVDSMYAEIVDINMVDFSEAVDTGIPIEASMPEEKVQVDAEMVTENHQSNNAVVTEDQFAEKMTVAYPRAKEDLIDFLNRCKISNTNDMLSPGAVQFLTKKQQCLWKVFVQDQRGKGDGLTTVKSLVSTKEVFPTRWNRQRGIQTKIKERLSTLLQSLPQTRGCFLAARNLAILPHQLSGLKELPPHPIRKRHRIITSMPTTTITKGNTL